MWLESSFRDTLGLTKVEGAFGDMIWVSGWPLLLRVFTWFTIGLCTVAINLSTLIPNLQEPSFDPPIFGLLDELLEVGIVTSWNSIRSDDVCRLIKSRLFFPKI